MGCLCNLPIEKKKVDGYDAQALEVVFISLMLNLICCVHVDPMILILLWVVLCLDIRYLCLTFVSLLRMYIFYLLGYYKAPIC
jgi:hypothetical protein